MRKMREPICEIVCGLGFTAVISGMMFHAAGMNTLSITHCIGGMLAIIVSLICWR